jgi:hypothetical protein
MHSHYQGWYIAAFFIIIIGMATFVFINIKNAKPDESDDA